MIRSMTAFARRERPSEWGLIIWEVRSVNHRYLEIATRLPEALRALELPVRERIGGYASRGKIECTLKLQSGAGVLTDISLSRPLVERLLVIGEELRELMGSEAGLRPVDILCWPGAVSEAEPDLEQVRTAIFDCLEGTLTDLVASREGEGARIAEMIRQRCDAMSEQIQRIRVRRPQVLAKLRDKLLARLAELPVEADAGRLEQELVFFAQRLDVEEELDRLDSHLAEVQQVLGRGGPVGRRLDFLMQELNREANTLASKSGDTETTRAAVELKVLIEQMREQVQNIE